jgi:hypothetical protein
MAGDTQSWVSQYGDALASLDNYTKNLAAGGAPPGQPGAPIAPAQQGAFAAAAQNGATPQPALAPPAAGPAPGALQAPGQAHPALPSAGLPPPADQNSTNPHNFHNMYNALPDDDKSKIADQLEQNGVDIKAHFKQMQSDGIINAPTADYAKNDMAGFVMEAGLRMAQAGARGDYYSNPFASAATGVLGAVESRRDRQMQANQMAFNQQNIQYQRELDLAKLKQEKDLGVLQRQTQIDIARENEKSRAATAQTQAGARTGAAQILANSRAAAAATEAGKPTANDTIQDDQGNVFWKTGPNAGKPVLVDDGQGGQRQIKAPMKAGTQQKPAFTEKDVEGAVSKHESDLNKNQFTSKVDDGNGGQVSWAKATEAQKQAHLSTYATGVRTRAAGSGPQGGGAAQGTNPYAKFVKGGSSGAQPVSGKQATQAVESRAGDQDDEAAVEDDDDDDKPAVEP